MSQVFVTVGSNHESTSRLTKLFCQVTSTLPVHQYIKQVGVSNIFRMLLATMWVVTIANDRHSNLLDFLPHSLQGPQASPYQQIFLDQWVKILAKMCTILWFCLHITWFYLKRQPLFWQMIKTIILMTPYLGFYLSFWNVKVSFALIILFWLPLYSFQIHCAGKMSRAWNTYSG